MNVQYSGNKYLNDEGKGGEDSGKTSQETHVNHYDVVTNHREQTIPSAVCPQDT